MNGDITFTLTPREIQVLQMLASGCCNKQIANQLQVTIKTVEAHITKILQKLQVNSRGAAVIKAIKEGIIELQ